MCVSNMTSLLWFEIFYSCLSNLSSGCIWFLVVAEVQTQTRLADFPCVDLIHLLAIGVKDTNTQFVCFWRVQMVSGFSGVCLRSYVCLVSLKLLRLIQTGSWSPGQTIKLEYFLNSFLFYLSHRPFPALLFTHNFTLHISVA